MAATPITKVTVPRNAVGYNLTDSADFATLTTGSGNGVKFLYEERLQVVLKNDSGGAAVFTFKVYAGGVYTTYSVTLTAPTKSVANGKTWLMNLGNTIFKKPDDGMIYIECDVAGKVLVLDP